MATLKYGYTLCRATEKWSKPAARGRVEHRMQLLPNTLTFNFVDGYWCVNFCERQVRISKDLILVAVLIDILYNYSNPAWIEKRLHEVLTSATEKMVSTHPETLELIPDLHTAIQSAGDL